jgi:membrane protease subunit (stomatin/prohibitin family)
MSSIPDISNLYSTSIPSRFIRTLLQGLTKPSMPAAAATTVKAAVTTAGVKAASDGAAGTVAAAELRAAGSGSGNATASPAAAAAAAAEAGRANRLANASAVPSPPGAASAKSTVRQGRPAFPFPQCINTTLSYDVSFVGKVQYVQVGKSLEPK